MEVADWLPVPWLTLLLIDAVVAIDKEGDVLASLELEVMTVDRGLTEALSVAAAEIVSLNPDVLARTDADAPVTVENRVEFDGALGPGRDHVELAARDVVPAKDAD